MILPPPRDLTSFSFRKWLESLVTTINGLGGGGVTDHGALSGLGDDDHSQYHNDSRGDARYYTQSQVDTALAGKSDTSHTHSTSDIVAFEEAIDDRVANLIVAGSNITATYNDGANTLTIAALGGGGNAVIPTLSFGSSFTDKAQTVVTGQSWVTATSKIIAQVLTPSGTDPDEMRLLDFKAVVSDLVVGVGFTVSLFTEAEAKGDYSVMCIGV